MDTFWTVDFTPVQMLPFTGLFHRSISHSGTATCPWAVKPKGRPKSLAEKVAGLFRQAEKSENRIQTHRNHSKEKNTTFRT
jgi:hypothetical protein